jgi:hypothetical protein
MVLARGVGRQGGAFRLTGVTATTRRWALPSGRPGRWRSLVLLALPVALATGTVLTAAPARRSWCLEKLRVL